MRRGFWYGILVLLVVLLVAMAVATPAKLPLPTVAASAVIKAA